MLSRSNRLKELRQRLIIAQQGIDHLIFDCEFNTGWWADSLAESIEIEENLLETIRIYEGRG